MPYPGLRHPEPLPLWQAPADPYLCMRHSNTVLAQSLWSLLVHTRFVWALWVSLMGMGFDSKHGFAPPTILLRFLLCPWMWDIFFFAGIQHSLVDGCSAMRCNFGLLMGEDECTSFFFAILYDGHNLLKLLPKVKYVKMKMSARANLFPSQFYSTYFLLLSQS